MLTIAVDVETYYDSDYSLRKMTPIEYILDPRFECMGWGVQMKGFTFFLEPNQFKIFLSRLPLRVAMVSHNSLFDMSVLQQRFNYTPALMIDTMGMSKAWWGHSLQRFSLKKVCEFLGLPEKGETVLKVMGMHMDDIKRAGLWKEYTDYCTNDTDLAMMIYRRAIQEGFPVSEIAIMDSVLRCAIKPKFTIDANLVAQHIAEVAAKKAALLARTGLEDRSTLMSNDKFAAALRSLGVDPPTKVSLTTGQITYAFAKTDPAFVELEEHEDDEVQALVSARMGIKSTLEETRSQRFAKIAQLTWPGNQQSLMPVPLGYGAAHTHRLGGEWKLNLQNLPRGGNLRKALKSPPGQKIIAADASQIEARIVACLAGQADLVEKFRNKEDVYSSFASIVFGYTINKDTHKDERFIGKTSVLGLGFGLGAEKFMRTIRLKSKLELKKLYDMQMEEAEKVVKLYRYTYHKIPAAWRFLDQMLPQMTRPGCCVHWGPVVFEHERIKLPSGLYLYYKGLENTSDGWKFTYGGKSKWIYGGKMLENIVQAIARIIVMDASQRIRRRLAAVGPELDMALQEHDALAYVAPEALAQTVHDILVEEMSRDVSWLPGLPLAVEAGIGTDYGTVK